MVIIHFYLSHYLPPSFVWCIVLPLFIFLKFSIFDFFALSDYYFFPVIFQQYENFSLLISEVFILSILLVFFCIVIFKTLSCYLSISCFPFIFCFFNFFYYFLKLQTHIFAGDENCKEILGNHRVWMLFSWLSLAVVLLGLQNISLFLFSVDSPGKLVSLIPAGLHMIHFLAKSSIDPLYKRGAFYIRISFSLLVFHNSQLFIRSWLVSHPSCLTQTQGQARCSQCATYANKRSAGEDHL